MILSTIMSQIFNILRAVIGLLVDVSVKTDAFDISSLTALIGKAFIVFPVDVFKLCISNVIFWLSVQMGWAIIEWVYKKIPGVS